MAGGTSRISGTNGEVWRARYRGSSGSPLYNQNHHAIGQLHGGRSACGNNLSDWYGRISVSAFRVNGWDGMARHFPGYFNNLPDGIACAASQIVDFVFATLV